MIKTISVSARAGHGLGKDVIPVIELIAGQGVAGDAHCGVSVKHRSRVAKDPTQPNLRQVHLIDTILLDSVRSQGFGVAPGELGENILVTGIDLLALATGTQLRFPSGATLCLTGLRNPCHQLNGHSEGLMNALLSRAPDGGLIRKGGVMATVSHSGTVRPGDDINVTAPGGALVALAPV